ncbi:MAG: hypothetical protein GY757_08345, partial [bacterium]|nr:hypothetical protein [bacterium]
QPEGYGRLGPVLDQCLLNLPAAKAVRNRRSILYKEIIKTINEKNGKTANIMSIACGPSREILDVLQSTSGEKALKATLLDFDLKALSFVDEELENLDLKKNVELVNENILLLISGRKKLLIEKQDFVYSIGLIDYFSDRIVIKLLNYIHSILHENGRVMVGNFHPQNPTKAFMDYVLEWPLIHRSEEDMNRLFMSSKFQRPCDKIIFEEEGINLFVECRKLE